MKKSITKRRVLPAEIEAVANRQFRVLVCGSRDWNDTDTINRELNRLIVEAGVRQHQVLVITGSTWEDDNGADSIVESLCRTELGLACAIFRAPWDFARKVLNEKRRAGPMRNAWMLKWGQPNYVLAFHPFLPNSRGTKNMCKQAREAGIPVRLITAPGKREQME